MRRGNNRQDSRWDHTPDEFKFSYRVKEALRAIEPPGDFVVQARRLLDVFGYTSERFFENALVDPRQFLNKGSTWNAEDKYLSDQAIAMGIIFNFTAEEAQRSLEDTHEDAQRTLWKTYDKSAKWGRGKRAESFWFCAVELRGSNYHYTRLSKMLKSLNRCYTGASCVVLFRYAETLAIGLVNRRMHKLDSSKDVLFNVSTIRKIPLNHIETYKAYRLYRISLRKCCEWMSGRDMEYNFDGLTRAWIEILKRDYYWEPEDWQQSGSETQQTVTKSPKRPSSSHPRTKSPSWPRLIKD